MKETFKEYYKRRNFKDYGKWCQGERYDDIFIELMDTMVDYFEIVNEKVE